jgi:O-succinylbenzoic acid--CoA ligase
MAGQSEAPLVAVVLPRVDAATAVIDAWDRGEAVAVVDPDAPPMATRDLLAALRPTHVLDADGRRPFPDGVPVAEGTAAVVATSGTTGAPKLVELTVAGGEAATAAFAARCGTASDDRWLVATPLHYVAGLAILARARHLGATFVVQPFFDVDAIAAAPADLGVTHVSVVPTMLRRLLDAGAPLHEFRRILVGAAATPPALRATADAAMAPVVETYGASETWAGVVYDGIALDGVDVRIDAGGEVQIHGPMLMRGYRFDPERTAVIVSPDGWYRTGDLGSIDQRGALHVVGRQDDLVNTGGVKVSPTAVEHVLAEHPGIADLCVAGRPDDEWGERVVAFVVPSDRGRPPSIDDVRAFGREHLAEAQLPREVVIVDTLPRTASGKVVRHLLPNPERP